LELNSASGFYAVLRTGTPLLGSGVARIRIRGIVVPETGLGRIRRMALIAIARGTRASRLS
jgi:hypothetical protein